MQGQQARQILQSLVQGLDPETGREIPPDSVLQQPAVMRALLTALLAIEQSNARQQRRARLPNNAGAQWSPEEEQALVDAFKSGEPLAEIAARHCRTLAAIEARLERLGHLTAEQRVTRDRFAAGLREPPEKGDPS
jgi:hypothetical protein